MLWRVWGVHDRGGVMHVELLVEEPSAEAALQNLLPRIVGPDVSFVIHPHQGKKDLLGKLPARLRGYARYLPSDCRVVVLVDRDEQECTALKRHMDAAARQVGLPTPGQAGLASALVVNRIAVEELEAWFLGDVEALVAAYPRLPASLGQRKGYRDPDSIRGGTWECLERALRQAGYYRGGLPKIEAARSISAHMEPERNRSRSFALFVRSLRELVAQVCP